MRDLTEVIGYIYKITSPNNKIYIGQTLNFRNRKYYYNSGNFKQQVKLYNNVNFYNWIPGDTFELIEECFCGYNKSFLNERERYWIIYYDSFKNGLNCNEGGHGNIGHKHSEDSKLKMKNAKLGIKHSKERNNKKSEYTKGRIHSDVSKKKMSDIKKQNMTDDIKDKIREGLIGNKNGIGNKGAARKVLCLNNNIIYDSIKSAADDLTLHATLIGNVCKGKNKQTGGYKFKYYEEEKNNGV